MSTCTNDFKYCFCANGVTSISSALIPYLDLAKGDKDDYKLKIKIIISASYHYRNKVMVDFINMVKATDDLNGLIKECFLSEKRCMIKKALS